MTVDRGGRYRIRPARALQFRPLRGQFRQRDRCRSTIELD